jgi:predicted ATPase/class 3 adenylate cyclase/Tfp pilus assembly protein PilF
MAQLPTGTVTFLFSDIEGSTQLLHQLGSAYADALGEHQALLRAAFTAHEGVEVDTQGDAFFVAFATAPRAVAAAAEATRALATREWPEGTTLRVRMGLHTGTPQLVGDHYVGLDVHRAARIAAAGHGGQILLSHTARMLTEHDLPGGTTLRDVGAHRLKDLQEPERLFQLVLPDLGQPTDFPPLKTLDIHRHNLPIQPTPLLGREEQVTAVSALLRRPEVRLVTLTGPGGIGKTRLAVQVAAELLDDFGDGVWFAHLSHLVDPALVVPTIAQMLGLQEQGVLPIVDALRTHLADKHLLLALDNFEQVVGAAPEVAALLAAAPGLKALVTSRTPLHLRGEHEYTLVPLPLPEPAAGRRPPEYLSQYAAVALFIERAQAARSDFAVTAANAPAIAEVCARLDGLPLAIELAAARVRLLPPEALLARLSMQLKVLTGGARDLEERQQTMRATIAWSEALLAPVERRLFWRLAVFVGGGTLEAAEAVCAAPPGAALLGLDVLDGLSTLVDQSLVQQRAESEEDGDPRFGMLHVIREYALERLQASDEGKEAEALRRAHAAYFLALAERAEPQLAGPEQGTWLARLEREHDNLRAVLGWAHSRGEVETGLRLVATLWRFWWIRGHLREGRAWVEALLGPESAAEAGSGPGAGTGAGAGEEVEVGTTHGTEAAGGPADTALTAHTARAVPERVLAGAQLAGGILALWQGDDATAGPWLEAAAAQARAVGDVRTAATALNYLGVLATNQRNWERAAVRYEESLALVRHVGDRLGIARALNNLGDLAVHQSDLEQAAAVLAEALALFRAGGDRTGAAICLSNLGWVAQKRGEMARAEALQREALVLARELGDTRRCAEVLEELAATAGLAGRGARAAHLLGVATAARGMIGAPQPPSERADKEEAMAAARAALGEEAWAAAFTAGQELSLEEAVADALARSI